MGLRRSGLIEITSGVLPSSAFEILPYSFFLVPNMSLRNPDRRISCFCFALALCFHLSFIVPPLPDWSENYFLKSVMFDAFNKFAFFFEKRKFIKGAIKTKKSSANGKIFKIQKRHIIFPFRSTDGHLPKLVALRGCRTGHRDQYSTRTLDKILFNCILIISLFKISCQPRTNS
jgi:hypothetical protein